MQVQPPIYRYRVDGTDRIVWVDDWWLAFARENGAPDLDPTAVIGQPLWDFLSGRTTQEVFRQVHERVRSTGCPLTIRFRCDSPTLERYMRMTISPEEDRHLLYESAVLRTVATRAVNILNSKWRRTSAVLTMCSCCKKVLVEPLGWSELHEICGKLKFFEAERVPDLRYDICPRCASIILGKADNGVGA